MELGSLRLSRRRLACFGASAVFAALTGCSSAPPVASAAPAPVRVRVAAPAPPAPASARDQAEEAFLHGKALALGGDPACARAEFQRALDGFQSAQRRDDPSDLEFGEHLYDSVLLYQSLLDSPEDAERPPAEDTQDTLLAAAPTPSAEEVEKAKAELADSTWSERFDIPMTVNEAVLRAVAFYQFRTPQHFAAALQRSGKYLDLMRQLLREEGLPQDLVYVAMIESAFKHQAHSRKAAHGFWQFIDGTARRYGLRRTRYVEERSDFVKSTRAAAAYLRDLYEMFGDWYLALAGYSAGEGRVIRGLQRTGARDYWGLCAAGALPRETRDYVPFVLAAALIGKDPLRFGFDVLPDPPLSWDVVTLDRPTELSRLAEAIGADPDHLRLLNSELRGRTTPRGLSAYPLRVPVGRSAALVERLAGLPAAPEVEEKRVAVRRGDTLKKIASRFGVSIEEICDLNDLTKKARLRRGTTLLVPVRSSRRESVDGAVPRLASGSDAPVAAVDRRSAGEIRALPTPAAAIADARQLEESRPIAEAVPSSFSSRGPRVVAPVARPLAASSSSQPTRVDIPSEGFESAPGVANARAGGPARSSGPQHVSYTVRKGDTLYSIATRHGTTVEQLRRANRIGPRSLLRAGQRLTVLAFVN